MSKLQSPPSDEGEDILGISFAFVGNIVGSFVDGLVLFSGEILTHHKLKVYEKALAFGACAEELSASGGRQHAN